LEVFGGKFDTGNDGDDTIINSISAVSLQLPTFLLASISMFFLSIFIPAGKLIAS
jgi:hypothetical protein